MLDAIDVSYHMEVFFLYKLLFIFCGLQQAQRHFNVHLTYILMERGGDAENNKQ